MSVKNEVQEFSLLVGIDEIFDTVFGTIMKDFPQAHEQHKWWYEQGYYHHRQCDEFPGIDRAAFKAAYARRDIETLQNTFISGVPLFIAEQLYLMWNKVILEPFRKIPKLTINFWPYKFTEDEAQIVVDNMTAKIGERLNAPVAIHKAWIPREEMTIDFTRSNFSHILMYDQNTWLNMIGDKFDVNYDLKMVELFCPAISDVVDPRTRQDSYVDMGEMYVHAFGAYHMLTSQVIGLELIDARLWSFLAGEDVVIPDPYEKMNKDLKEPDFESIAKDMIDRMTEPTTDTEPGMDGISCSTYPNSNDSGE